MYSIDTLRFINNEADIFGGFPPKNSYRLFLPHKKLYTRVAVSYQFDEYYKSLIRLQHDRGCYPTGISLHFL